MSWSIRTQHWARRSTLGSLQFAWYTISAIPAWLGTEIAAGFVQFTLYCVLLGFIDARQRESPSAAAA